MSKFRPRVKGYKFINFIAGMVAHPVTQVIGEQAIVDILDLSKVAWTCWGCTNTSSGLGLRMVKDSDL